MIRLIQFLLRSKRVRMWLISRALKKPFVHLEGYMSRYWLCNERWRIPLLPAIRIHCIHRRDGDRDLHDHPFDFRSFVLFGSYVEQDVMGHQKLVKQGDTYYSPAERFHAIVHVSPSDVIYPAGGFGVWTLVILSRKRQPWGFLTWVNGEIRKVHHSQYQSNNKYTDSATEPGNGGW